MKYLALADVADHAIVLNQTNSQILTPSWPAKTEMISIMVDQYPNSSGPPKCAEKNY
jgi:hypothetical protein